MIYTRSITREIDTFSDIGFNERFSEAIFSIISSETLLREFPTSGLKHSIFPYVSGGVRTIENCDWYQEYPRTYDFLLQLS